MFNFEITTSDTHSQARTGTFTTPHGSFSTPCFMPCGTKGAVKTLTPDELRTLGCEIILVNTFHMMLRPGAELVQKMGGLHKFMNWDRPILTDSGGFQVFSLARLRKVSDEGVSFHSPIDGSTHFLSPERAIEIQEQLGADIIMAFDECPPGDADHSDVKKAADRTHRWLERCFAAKKRNDQALFPIVQGGVFEDLRRESAEFVSGIDAPGYAIGGVAVGESKEHVRRIVEFTAPLLPQNKPRYLMGVGEPDDIVAAVAAGVDMFDCVIPTRLARHGSVLTKNGRTDITKSEYAASQKPVEDGCACYTCQKFTLGYLRHLMQEGEILGHRLLTIHNLHFLLELMRAIRRHIAAGTFKEFYEKEIGPAQKKARE